MTEKNIAIIGGGKWGENLVRNFERLGALYMICDTNIDVLNRFKGIYPDVNMETSLDSVLNDRDIAGVVIATPAMLHHTIAKKALLANKDTYVEKPLSLNTTDGNELVTLAKERNKILMVGHLMEYHPAIVKLKELVNSGELGKIQYIYSNRLNLGKFRTEENILWSFAPHDISIILSILNELPERVSAHGGFYLNKDIADVTTSMMQFASGVRAHIFVSWLHPYKEQRLVIVGEKAMAAFDDVLTDNKLQLYPHKIDWVGRSPVPHYHEGTPIEIAKDEPLSRECQHFIDCIKLRKTPQTDGISALKVLKVLEACQSSLAAEGSIIYLDKEGDFFVHETSIVEMPVSIGGKTKIWHFSHVMPRVTIGHNCNIGQNVFIGANVNIGNNVKIQNNVSVYDGVTIEDEVFCGPSCVFTNDKRPRSAYSKNGVFDKTLVKRGSTIGANATIVCGTTIGKYSFVGAGSLVTKDVPDYSLVYGNPARIQGWTCQCGTSISFNGNDSARCPSCKAIYEKQDQEKIISCRDKE
ncbi:Gfo/Idh/MocA family oxidoreductase [Chloroflexota bacterium]